MQVLKIISITLFTTLLTGLSFSCSTTPEVKDLIRQDNSDFFNEEPGENEAFKVLITSDTYIIEQNNFQDKLIREDDPEGDKYICEQLKIFDKVDIKRDAVISINLYPDTGKLMKIRPKSLTYIMEIDNLIVEDLKRWNLEYAEERTGPGVVDVKYRVILRKKQSDEEIMKEVIEKVKEEEAKKAYLEQRDE